MGSSLMNYLPRDYLINLIFIIMTAIERIMEARKEQKLNGGSNIKTLTGAEATAYITANGLDLETMKWSDDLVGKSYRFMVDRAEPEMNREVDITKGRSAGGKGTQYAYRVIITHNGVDYQTMVWNMSELNVGSFYRSQFTLMEKGAGTLGVYATLDKAGAVKLNLVSGPVFGHVIGQNLVVRYSVEAAQHEFIAKKMAIVDEEG